MEGSKEKKPRRTLKGLFQKNLRPETFEKRYTLKEKSATIDAAVASDEAVPSAEAELLKSLHTRCILVKAICGTGLRAADSNNLSDPVSCDSVITRSEEATLLRPSLARARLRPRVLPCFCRDVVLRHRHAVCFMRSILSAVCGDTPWGPRVHQQGGAQDAQPQVGGDVCLLCRRCCARHRAGETLDRLPR